MATGHVPYRRCLGCGARGPKHTLARFAFVREGDEEVVLIRDDVARRGGRGLYVCPRRACFDLACQRGGFVRAARLGRSVQIDPAQSDEFER